MTSCTLATGFRSRCCVLYGFCGDLESATDSEIRGLIAAAFKPFRNLEILFGIISLKKKMEQKNP